MRLAPRVLTAGLAVALAGAWTLAVACDKSTSASAANGSKTYVKAAAAGSCAAHGAKTTAVSASNAGACAGHAHKTTAVNAVLDESTDRVKAVATGGSHCSGQGMVQGSSAHADCDACSDMFACGEELDAAGARLQVVRLRNGVMFVYTANSPGKVNAVQSAMARRNSHLAQFVSSGEKAKLCSECRTMRNAMAVGKLNREVVNIEGGALTLMTSSDPTIVAKIHAMVDDKAGTRAKI